MHNDKLDIEEVDGVPTELLTKYSSLFLTLKNVLPGNTIAISNCDTDKANAIKSYLYKSFPGKITTNYVKNQQKLFVTKQLELL